MRDRGSVESIRELVSSGLTDVAIVNMLRREEVKKGEKVPRTKDVEKWIHEVKFGYPKDVVVVKEYIESSHELKCYSPYTGLFTTVDPFVTGAVICLSQSPRLTAKLMVGRYFRMQHDFLTDDGVHLPESFDEVP